MAVTNVINGSFSGEGGIGTHARTHVATGGRRRVMGVIPVTDESVNGFKRYIKNAADCSPVSATAC